MTLEFDCSLRLGPFDYEAALQARSEILVLFGHSGAGKSVTLQLVAGLLRPDRGRITINGALAFDSALAVSLRPQDRRVGYVVQDLALFPHLSVERNIGFGIPRHPDRATIVTRLVAQLHLQGLEHRLPRTLSGGQQQRVALARALATDARLLLLDEPFSALDESLRSELRRELLRLKSELGLTILFVTHDLREAHLLADRIAVFDAGRVLQLAPRDEVFRRPASRRVAQLTAVSNIWPGTVASSSAGHAEVDCQGLRLLAPNPASFQPGQSVHAVVRAERVILRRQAPPDTPNILQAQVAEEFAYGASHLLHLRPLSPGPLVEVDIAARPYEVLGIATQKTWTVEIPSADIHLVPGD